MTKRKLHGAFGILTLVLCTVLVAGDAMAQDSHYWDNQYGTKAELLGGLVVGSPTDLSSTFYNPGWIALQNAPSVLLTTKAAEIYSITLKDTGPRGADPSSLVITPSPGYLAGRFSVGDDSTWKWAYTYLQKVKFEYNAAGLRIDRNPAPPPDGNIWFSGEAFRDSRADESWYGVSLSRKLSDNVALGFSPYVAHRGQRSRTQIMAQALDAASTYADVFLVDEFDYWHIRVLLKIGLAAEWDRWSAGLTITTPSLSIMGDGSVYQNASVYSSDHATNPDSRPPYLQANAQEDLDPVWKSPMSIAAGGAVQLGQTRLHVTAEWFNAVARYTVLNPESYEIQSRPGQFADYELDYAAKSLVNLGIGVDRAFTERFSLFTSYRTDFSTVPNDQDNILSFSVWDLNHVTGGASFQFMSIEFTAGLQYSWGSGDSHHFIDYGSDENGDVSGEAAKRGIVYKRLKALLGFNLPLSIPGS